MPRDCRSRPQPPGTLSRSGSRRGRAWKSAITHRAPHPLPAAKEKSSRGRHVPGADASACSVGWPFSVLPPANMRSDGLRALFTSRPRGRRTDSVSRTPRRWMRIVGVCPLELAARARSRPWRLRGLARRVHTHHGVTLATAMARRQERCADRGHHESTVRSDHDSEGRNDLPSSRSCADSSVDRIEIRSLDDLRRGSTPSARLRGPRFVRAADHERASASLGGSVGRVGGQPALGVERGHAAAARQRSPPGGR